jgi:hypothetical protein
MRDFDTSRPGHYDSLDLISTLKNISKGRFLETLICPRMGWMLRHGAIEAIGADEYFYQFLADQGHIIGSLATEWFDIFLAKNKKPPGINIDTLLAEQGITRKDPNLWLTAAMDLTNKALQDPKVSAIYEATIHYNNFTTRADILVRLPDSWAMIEVKSIKDDAKQYLEDMAYTTGVLRKAGLNITKIGILHLDKEYQVQGHDILDLLKVDWTFQVGVDLIAAEWDDKNTWKWVDEITSTSTPPALEFSLKCRKCKACQPGIPPNSILEIPYISKLVDQFNALTENGIQAIAQIPDAFWSDTSAYQKNAGILTATIQEGSPYVSQKLPEALSSKLSNTGSQLGPIIWPVFYLDFETLSTAIPLFEGISSYSSVPVQFSLHRAYPQPTPMPNVYAPNMDLVHQDFVADPSKDQRLDLATALLKAFKEMGNSSAPNSTIFAYNASVERKAVLYLAGLFPEEDPRHQELVAISERIRDLLGIIRGGDEDAPSKKGFPRSYNFYHPEFKGGLGLKNVIAVLFKDRSPYAGLKIKGGDAAVAAYARLAYAAKYPDSPWKISDFDIPKILEDLRVYCSIDTYSMIILHHYLAMTVALGGVGVISERDVSYRDKLTPSRASRAQETCPLCGEVMLRSHG